MKRWNSWVPVGEIRVVNRLNTDTPPGPPSVESILTRTPTKAKDRGHPGNFESTKTQPTATKPAPDTTSKEEALAKARVPVAPATRPTAAEVAPSKEKSPAKAVAPAVPATRATAAEVHRRRKREKWQKNILKFMDGEPVTEESDSDSDERNLSREQIEQALVETVAAIASTDIGTPAERGTEAKGRNSTTTPSPNDPRSAKESPRKT